ncbi:MAG: hypothetical protein KDA24_14310, partial [Deltaproteobacteria bacterium]|nr:hypothetical protein [Deltaproteobacteria bacterium]
DDDATGDDDDATGDDDDATGDDDDSALEPFYYPGCTCSSSDSSRSGLLLLLPALLLLRRRRDTRSAGLLLGVTLGAAVLFAAPAPARAQEARTIVVLTDSPQTQRDTLTKTIPSGFGASFVDVTGEHNVGGLWVLGTAPERVCPQTSVPLAAVSQALERAQNDLDNLAVDKAEAGLAGVRQTLACLEGKLDPSELWRLYFLEGVAAFYQQGLPAARSSLARALAVLPGQYFDPGYPPDLQELYLELQKGALEGGRALVVAGSSGDGPGAIYIDGFPVSGPGLAVVPGEHILQVRLENGRFAGAVVRLIEDDIVAAALPKHMAEAGRRMELEQQRVLASWVKRWAGVREGRVWIRDGKDVYRLGEIDADRIEVVGEPSKAGPKGITLTKAQRDPVVLLNLGGGYQFAGRGSYGGLSGEASIRVKGPFRVALGARVMFSQPVIDPATDESLGSMWMVPGLVGAQLRLVAPFVQIIGLHFQMAGNPGGTTGGPVLPGAALQLGAEFPLGSSRLLIRPSVEVGNLGKFFTFRALIGVGLALGPAK